MMTRLCLIGQVNTVVSFATEHTLLSSEMNPTQIVHSLLVIELLRTIMLQTQIAAHHWVFEESNERARSKMTCVEEYWVCSILI